MSNVIKLLRLLTKNKRCEQIAQVTYQNWATMSDSLRLLTKNERPWANRSGHSPKMRELANRSIFLANRSFPHFLAKNELFAQKTDEQIPSPALTLLYCTYKLTFRVLCSSYYTYKLTCIVLCSSFYTFKLTCIVLCSSYYTYKLPCRVLYSSYYT